MCAVAAGSRRAAAVIKPTASCNAGMLAIWGATRSDEGCLAITCRIYLHKTSSDESSSEAPAWCSPVSHALAAEWRLLGHVHFVK
eukprot:1595100-Pyramimonas_sp.AAC.1